MTHDDSICISGEFSVEFPLDPITGEWAAPEVTWENGATGEAGIATVEHSASAPWEPSWHCTVPLAVGSNEVTITGHGFQATVSARGFRMPFEGIQLRAGASYRLRSQASYGGWVRVDPDSGRRLQSTLSGRDGDATNRFTREKDALGVVPNFYVADDPAIRQKWEFVGDEASGKAFLWYFCPVEPFWADGWATSRRRTYELQQAAMRVPGSDGDRVQVSLRNSSRARSR